MMKLLELDDNKFNIKASWFLLIKIHLKYFLHSWLNSIIQSLFLPILIVNATIYYKLILAG